MAGEEIISSIADVVTAGATCFAVWIAWSGVDQWQRETLGKRKTELAEEMLADFYQARAIIKGARFPGSFEGEGKTRKRHENETEAECKLFDSYYTVVERLEGHGGFFSQLFSRKFRVSAIFGKKTEELYTELHNIWGEIPRAVSMLIRTHRKDPAPRNDRAEKWENAIGWGDPDQDDISDRLDKLVIQVEALCRPIINPRPQQPSLHRLFRFAKCIGFFADRPKRP